MVSKILVANRGEIAIRAFRAAVELGLKTVAVYPFEDRFSLHRMKADEAYQIGEPGHPLRAYLTIEEIMRVAKLSGADAVYPGYGFLSENPDLARACEEAGIVFVGHLNVLAEGAAASGIGTEVLFSETGSPAFRLRLSMLRPPSSRRYVAVVWLANGNTYLPANAVWIEP